MKKVLIPIFSMAAVAPAMTGAVSCACSSGINLKFDVMDSDELFWLENFQLEVNKKYTFIVDLSKASDSFIEKSDDSISFYGGCWDPLVPFKLDKTSIIVKRNGVQLKEGGRKTDGQGYKINEQAQIIALQFDSEHAPTKTDKFTFTVAWSESNDKTDNVILVAPF